MGNPHVPPKLKESSTHLHFSVIFLDCLERIMLDLEKESEN